MRACVRGVDMGIFKILDGGATLQGQESLHGSKDIKSYTTEFAFK